MPPALMRILTVNAGSSSLKLALLDADDSVLAADSLPADSSGFDTDELGAVLRSWPSPDATGHRVVHGGRAFAGPVLMTADVRRQLDELTMLAPLHQPKSLAALDAVTAHLPDTPAVACFDTAFHATLPGAAATYAVPREWRQRYGVRRYGFHGLSHAYCAGRAAELTGRELGRSRMVTCHLGAGASLTAVVDGRSVDTTMGFTPLEGLVMATRSGTVDPGLVLWLEEHEHLAPRDVATALEHRSGLAALAGTPDMREIERRAESGDADAQLALAVYLHRLVTGIGAMAAAAGGIDVLAFTGGVGEHSATIRRGAAECLAHLGVAVDRAANERGHLDSDISAPHAAARTVVIAAREDLQLARETRAALSPQPKPRA
jgi:acetate kinase